MTEYPKTLRTLRDLVGTQHVLHGSCVKCLRWPEMPTDVLASKMAEGWDTRLDSLKERLVCSECGERFESVFYSVKG